MSESAISSKFASPRRVAVALGVSESSVKRWCDDGRLATVKTPGGHRKIPVAAVLRFARGGGPALVAPGALAGDAPPAKEPAAARRALLRALLDDDDGRADDIVRGQWRAGWTLDRVADDLVAPVLAVIGERWADARLQIYEERRACELVHRTLHRIAEDLPPPASAAPRAIGGTLEGDPFTIATALAEVVLRERGFDARSLGSWLPSATLARAIADAHPRLVWIAVGSVRDESRLLAAFVELEAAATAAGATLVVGGRALRPELRRRLRYAAHCDGMLQLASFARALAP